MRIIIIIIWIEIFFEGSQADLEIFYLTIMHFVVSSFCFHSVCAIWWSLRAFTGGITVWFQAVRPFLPISVIKSILFLGY